MSWVHRRELLAQTIRSYAPDLVGTQEGKRPQLEDLASLLPSLQLVASHRPWIEERMYPCIFINPQTIELHDSGDFWLSQTPHVPGSLSFKSTFPRLATWIRASYKSEKKSFLFIVTHLDHVLPYTREEQIKVLLIEMEKINKERNPCILAGDFNEGPKENVRAVMTQYAPRLYDPWQKLGHKEEPSHHHFGPAALDASRIDWFMIDKKFQAEEIFLDKISDKGIYPSDHYPLKLTLSFPSA